MANLVLKILSASDWNSAVSSGVYSGSSDDLRDGYIHFSTAQQVAGTAAKHFAGQADLVVAAIPADLLGPALKWEASRDGDLFPHLYGVLDPALAAWVEPMPLGDNGVHVLPQSLTV